MHFSPKYKFKFLLKLTLSKDDVQIKKTNTILNQLSIEESSNLDTYLKEYFETYTNIKENLINLDNYKVHLYLIFWKREQLYPFFKFYPLSLEFLLKTYISEFKKIKLYNFKNKTLNEVIGTKIFLKKLFFFSSSFICSNSFNSESGSFFSFQRCKNITNTFAGYYFNYLTRKKMLGRKIDFKNKLLSKKSIAF